jgi:hypothetical protein
MTEKRNFIGSAWQFRKRLMWILKSRSCLIVYHIKRIFSGRKNKMALTSHADFQPGEMVRVRSKAEIMPTLDGMKRYEGCRFMDEMWQFCGGTYKILKKVNQMVDEREVKLMKLKNVYILEGLICEGSWPFTSCDRSCFYFWKAVWLEKVN